jgi:hypothetical protein
MTLRTGSHSGPHEILATLGAGGIYGVIGLCFVN